MTENPPDLASLRRDIDGIDDALHDLLMRRAALASGIRDAKRAGRGEAWRPAREAAILRRLLRRHAGRFPVAGVARVWREIIGAFLGMQGPFSVAAYAPDGEYRYWDLARNHFGASVPIRGMGSARAVVRAVAEGAANVGLAPLPHESEAGPWWPLLLARAAARPRIVARVPFAHPAQRSEDVAALLVACQSQEPTGEDHSFLALRVGDEVSRASLAAVLAAEQLPPRVLIANAVDDGTPTVLFLAEIPGFVAEDDPRIAALLAADARQVLDVWPIGGYADPFLAAEEAKP